jgi:hypothetical protein
MRQTAIAVLVITAAAHLYLAPEHLDEMPYIGVLFVLGGVGSLVAAAWLAVRDSPLAWASGGLLCAGMLAALVLSRTTGLPDFKEHGLEPLALVCLIDEAAFLALWAFSLRSATRSPRRHPGGTADPERLTPTM